ncbi:hypothetical protein [Reichenbachiella sp.]|uniref:hypothetical protein n=1 Tax=Reichenbachiella sp. TaxID=2184521 RepID=UPI003BAFFD2B
MENQKTKLENDVLEVLTSGIDKTAGSLGVMIDQDVEIMEIELKQDPSFLLNPEGGSKENMILLRTQLIGDVAGLNYFLISEKEAKAISGAIFSNEFEGEVADLKELMTEFLKEVENVMAAATISELADKLDMSMFGDVPRIQSLSLKEISEIMNTESNQFGTAVQLNCRLSVPGLQIYPVYVWLFNKSFLDTIEGKKSEETIEKV